ncbi:PREDICTED: mucin-17 isoform X2 [Rhagoletis zephyria]|uniref:mucin-17 isoform X1 n=1 Tax=Rhagoletis zephyria TaxID=28612 RepID=UPI0008118A46|nr:PREDICTED: mucin-17 isoform X1 [Rhagoletis zephyria]XP_017476547.1 PREDICTED: mucin-17 isoform X2 [Rhagoletis zephyria]
MYYFWELFNFSTNSFAYCINSDDEGNTSSEIPSITESENGEEVSTSTDTNKSEAKEDTSSQLPEVCNNELGISNQTTASKDSADGKIKIETLPKERRSVTPELQRSAPTIASTPLIKLDYTPKADLINCTQNKENKSTEKKRSLLSLCHQSDVVITSYSPRETGVRIEKSFTAVCKPSATCLARTPRSVYSTPKSVLSDYNDEGSRDFIDFTTPATSKKAFGSRTAAGNSSMHLIDLTTPSVLAPASSRRRPTFKCNKTLPSDVKLSTTPLAFSNVKEGPEEEEGVHTLPGTPLVEPSTSKSNITPQSAESVISVDGSTDSSTAVIEISTEDSATPSTSSPSVRAGAPSKTPQRGGHKQVTSTPLRTPQSLMKRAILTSAKKQINTPLRTAPSSTTPIRQLPTTPMRKVNMDETGGSARSTLKGRIAIGSPSNVAAAQRRSFTTGRSLAGASSTSTPARERAITTSTPLQMGATLGRKVPASASRAAVAKRTSPLRGVRKSFGSSTLTSHISKPRRSIVPPRKHSPTSIGAQLVAKARKSLCTASASRSQVASRARSLVAAAIKGSGQNETTNLASEKTKNEDLPSDTPGKEGKENVLSDNVKNEVNELSRTFTVDDSLEEVNLKAENASTAQNVIVSPVKQDSIKQMDASMSQNQEINKTFSPEKSVSVVGAEAGPDIPVDVAETIGFEKQEKSVQDFKENKDNNVSEHISESFAEVVESSDKPIETTNPQEGTIASQQHQERSVRTEQLLGTSATTLETDQQDISADSNRIKEIVNTAEAETQETSKESNDRVLETLDADEVSSSVMVAQLDANEAETILVTPVPTEGLEDEGAPKATGESQGTAELLEEIDYVLNKSDELQQQLGKDIHNTSSGNEDAVELEAAISANVGEKIEELVAKDNTNVSHSTAIEGALTAEQETNTNKLEADVEDFTISDQNADNAVSEDPNSSKMAPDAKPGVNEDVSSTDSDILPSTSEIVSTGSNASSVKTEMVSITSITTPSEFDVSTTESSSVEKTITSEEQEGASKQPIIISEVDQITNNPTEPEMKMLEITTAEVNTSNAPESTKGDLEEKPVDHSEGAPNELADETKATKTEPKSDDIASEAAVVESVQIELIENEETEIFEENILFTDDEVEQQTSVTDKDIHATPADCEAKSLTIAVPNSNKFGKVETDKSFIGNTMAEPVKAIEESVSELKGSSVDSGKPAVNPTSIENDSNEVSEATKKPTQASNEFATMSIDTNTTVIEVHENVKTVEAVTNEEEEEKKIIAADEDNKSIDIATETGASALEGPKTPNLRGIREMLRTPKQSQTSTPRFIGLRNLMRTPKASTSAAAASAAVEGDEEELIGIQTLLKTPLQSRMNAQTPQLAIDSSTYTPRRSARRRASANEDLTPTRCITPTLEVVTEAGTPRRSTRRRASASAEVSYTPHRITRRRSSLSLDNEEAVAASLTPHKRGGLRARLTTILTECSVAEDMGAIIEEEFKEAAQESIDIQQHNLEADKHSVGEISEATEPNLAKVIEESICEEVNTKTQQDVEINPATFEVVNVENEENSNVINEVRSEQACELPDDNIKSTDTESECHPDSSFNELQTDEKDIVHNTSDSTANAKAIATNDGAEELSEIDALVTVKTNESDEILDESDYEYGKEVKEEARANSDADMPPKTPKRHRKSVKILDTATETPKTPKPCADAPKLIGVRDLGRTSKSTVETAAADLTDDEERFSGLADLVKTPTAITRVTKKAHEEEVVWGKKEEQEEPSSSNATHETFVGMRELLKTPKHTSTPQYRGMRELLRTPKACSTPQLGGLDELMQTPKRSKLNAQYDDEDVELDQFFKTPRAKDVMIPGEPASAVLEPSADTMLDIMTATTEYELHSNSQRPLEDIYKTPVSTRLTSVDTTITEDVEENTEKESKEEEDKNVVTSTTGESDIELIVPETPAAKTTTKRNLSAEEVFEELVGERTTLDETPPQKVYERKRRSVVATDSLLSPFSATDIISDLPKTDIQEWVDNLDENAELEEEEQEVTVSASLLESSKEKQDPFATSACKTSVIGVNKDTTEELLADISAVSSMADPLLPSASKSSKSVHKVVADENDTLRPTTPIESEISGINLLDQTNESVFSEPLIVSDSESMQDKGENDAKEKEKTDVKSNKSGNDIASTGANKSMGEEEFPVMFVDSSDSEAEYADGIDTNDDRTKPAESTTQTETPAVEETIKSAHNTEIIDLDDSSASESIESTVLSNSKAFKKTKVSDIHTEFSNFQPHKNLASQQMRASTPNRCSKVRQPQYTRGRRQSMGAEKLLASSSIDLTLEKSRLAGERANSVALVDKCIIEIDEESVDLSSVSEIVTNFAEEADNTAKMENNDQNKKVNASKPNEEFDTEFSNFQAHKTITSQGRRAATPDQVNKTRAQKILQAPRRLTLGAEQRLSDVTVDFIEEKAKLEKCKQKPTLIDECIQEVDDSDKECDTNAEVAQNYISASEKTAKVENSNDVSKEETLKPVQVMEEKLAIATVGLSEQVDKVKPADETTASEGQEFAETSDEPTEQAVETEEAEINSTATADDVDDVQRIQDATEISALEVKHTEPIEQKLVEPDIKAIKDVTIAKPSAEDVILENENQPEVSLSAEASIEKDNATDKPVAKEVKLQENEAVIPSNVESSIGIDTTTKGSLGKEFRIQENNSEIPSTTKSSTVKNDSGQKLESAGDVAINVVPGEGSENASPIENEFNESDIFDLCDELPKKPLTVNTTQGVIFDLTEEEADEESVEKKIEEIATQDVSSSSQQIAKTKSENASDEVKAGEMETVVATELKNTEVALKIAVDESIVNVVSSKQIYTESKDHFTITTENGAPTPIIELNISQESTDLTSAVVEEDVSANMDVSTVNQKDKQEAETKIIGQLEATAVEQQSQPDAVAEAYIDTEVNADVQSLEEDEMLVLAVSVESTADADIIEDAAETSQAAVEIPNESQVYTATEEVPKLIRDTSDEMELNNANSETAPIIADTDVLVEVEAGTNIIITEEKAETLNGENAPVLQVDDSVIQLDSDVEEIAEEPLSNTVNKQKTAIEIDITPATIEIKAKEEMETVTVKEINSEKIVTATPAIIGAEVSEHVISEKSEDDVKEKVIEVKAQSNAAENIAETTHTREESPVKTSELVAIEETKDAGQQNKTEASVQQIKQPDEGGELDEPAPSNRAHQAAKCTDHKPRRSEQTTAEIDELAAESMSIADQTEASVQQASMSGEDLDAPNLSDRAHQPTKRTGRKPSRSKPQGAKESEPTSKAATEIKSVSEKPAAIIKEPYLDTTAKLVEEKVQLEPLPRTETIGESKSQEQDVEKNTDKPIPSSLNADRDNNEEIVDATSSEGKQEPAKRRLSNPSRSKKTAAEEKVQSKAEKLTEGEIVVMNVDLPEQKLQLDTKLPEHKEESENKSEEIVPETPTEDMSVESSMQVAEVESSEPLVKRRGRKPSQSKQTAPEKCEEICKATIENVALEEDERETIKEKHYLEKTEENILNTETEMPKSELEEADKVCTPETSTKTTENVAKEEKVHEETTSNGKQQPNKRKGRKQSQSKQTTEAIEEPISEAIIENKALVEEIEMNAKNANKSSISKANIESKTLVEESAPFNEQIAEKKAELQTYIKASYEVLFKSTSETANIAEDDKPIGGAYPLPSSSEKSKIENKPATLIISEHEDKAVKTTTEPTSEARRDISSSTETIAETEPDKHEDSHAQRPTRRNRKGSQSSQCSTQDEDHLPTTTRRRGGRRRAETPVELSTDEATSSDAPTSKRRRGPGKIKEDVQLEDIKEVQNDEPEITTEEQHPIKTAEVKYKKKLETEVTTDDNNSEKKFDKIDDVCGGTPGAEEVIQEVDEVATKDTDTLTKRGTSRRRHGVAAEAAENEEKISTSKINTEITYEHHIDVEVPVTSAIITVAKRGKRKQTVSESSQTSNKEEHIESHPTHRHRRGRRPTNEEPEVVETSETSKEEDAAAIAAVLPTLIEVTEVVSSNVPEEGIDKVGDAIKTERENEECEHHSTAETSKRALTRNKRTLKSSQTTKGSPQLSEASEDLKVEPNKETPLLKEEEPVTKAANDGRTRVNRRKKAETDEEHERKTEAVDEAQNVDESAGTDPVAKTSENAEPTVEQLSNAASESVGGRRGRRGAAAAATVAINEVSSAHKRGAPRGKTHQNKPQTAQQQEEMKKEIGEDIHAEDGGEVKVVEDKKPHKAIRKRRGSTAEGQSAHADGAEKSETEEKESTKAAAKRVRRRRESHHEDESQSTNKQGPQEEATTSSAPKKSPIAVSSKQRSGRKRKDSLNSVEGTAAGDGGGEPPKKRPLSRKRRDSSLDSSIHEGTGGDADNNAGGNTSSSSTTPQRSRNIPRRAAAAQDRNYDESSDAEAQVDLKRRIEKAALPKINTISATIAANAAPKQWSPSATKTSPPETTPATVKEIASKAVSTPILSAVATTSRGGRQRKPTARVQQYLEEERAKAETPKKRLLLNLAAGAETPTSQARGTPVRRGRKASAIETEAPVKSHTPVRGRARTEKAVIAVAVTSEESRSELEHTHSELETTHSSSHAEEKELKTTAQVIKRPGRRGKHAEANIPLESDLNEAHHTSAAMVSTPTPQAHTASGRSGRAAKAAAAAALITDEPTGSHTKARVGRGRRGAHATEEEQHTDVETKGTRAQAATPSIETQKPTKQARTATAAGRGVRGGRRNKQLDDDDDARSYTSQNVLQEDSEASSSGGPQLSLAVDADDEHEEDEEALTITEEVEDKPLATVKGGKAADKKRTVTTRKPATRATESPAPKRGRRRAVAEQDDATHIDTASESTGSSRSRKVVRFDAATPSSTTSAEMPAEAVAVEMPAEKTAPAKRATRSRRK